MNAFDLIVRWEGLHDLRDDGLVYPYLDPIGIPTIGYGFTDRRIINAAPHTPERMGRMLEFHIWRLQDQLVCESPILAMPANGERLDAITSWTFNLGLSAYRRSTMRRRVDKGDWERAATEARRWVYAGGRPFPGLIARRADEARWIA